MKIEDRYLPCKYFQNHADPYEGTENTPQCKKIPILASSYQGGMGLLSKDSQVGSYWTLKAVWPEELKFWR